jgi:CRP/FNR family transcriptional regulator, nitrogen fixation regulation protein
MQTALTATGLQIVPAAALRGHASSVRRPLEAPALGSARDYATNEEIFAEGARAGFFYKVVSGVVRTSKLLSDGRRQIDAFHLTGDIFGLENCEAHRFSAEAVGNASVISYRRSSLDTLASADNAMSRQVVAAMMRSLERAQSHMLLLGRKSAKERIATFLLDLSTRMADDAIDLPMSRTDIADHLGLTIETVSRSFTELERDGVIEVLAPRRSIVLCDKAALRRLDA